MKYPTMAEVEAADRSLLAEWHWFLPSPGTSAGSDSSEVHADLDFDAVFLREFDVLYRIANRFHELGGWSPEISKKIGWARTT